MKTIGTLVRTRATLNTVLSIAITPVAKTSRYVANRYNAHLADIETNYAEHHWDELTPQEQYTAILRYRRGGRLSFFEDSRLMRAVIDFMEEYNDREKSKIILRHGSALWTTIKDVTVRSSHQKGYDELKACYDKES